MFLRKLFFIIMLITIPFYAQAEGLKVIAGTSLIEDIVKDLSGGNAEIITIIPGSSCPGHEGSKTTDFVFAAKADLLIIHPFQQNMPQVKGLIDSVKNENLRLELISPSGSWLIPEVQIRATNDILAVLSKLRPEEAVFFNERAGRRIVAIEKAGAESLAKLSEAKGTGLVVSSMLSEFISWAGFEVVESYGRAEEMTPKDVARIIDRIKGKVHGVADNYQSGADVGLPFAYELKIPQVVLSNFPGSTDKDTDYVSLLRYNTDQLMKLVK